MNKPSNDPSSTISGAAGIDRHSIFSLGLVGPVIACLLMALALLSHANTPDGVIDDSSSDPEVICEPLPGEPTLSERLEDALRFAIDPAASAGPIRKLAAHRPGHLFAIISVFSLNGESWQKWDHAMARVTAPAKMNRSEIVRVMEAVTAGTATEESSGVDLDWVWQRILEAHPIEEVEVDWACLRSEPHDEETIHAMLGYGLESCGVLEHVEDLSEAEALAASHGWTSVELKRLDGHEATIDGTDLTAPLYAIREVRFDD